MNRYVYRNDGKTKHCIIFDLDQTLIATQDNNFQVLENIKNLPDPNELKDRVYELTAEPEDGEISPYHFWGVIRPGTLEFLNFCFSYFTVVGVWSAGSHNYVHEIVNEIFIKRLGKKPHVILTRRDIVGDIDTQVYKPLTKLYNLNEVFARYTDEKNTLIIDDNYGTAYFNVDNIIHIKPYTPFPSILSMSQPDYCLKELQEWLESHTVSKCVDLRLLDKSKIFSF